MNWKLLLLGVPLLFLVSCGSSDPEGLTMEEIQQKLDSLEQRNRDLQRELVQQKEGIESKDETLKKVLVELESDRQQLKAQLESVQTETSEQPETSPEESSSETTPENLVEPEELVGLSEIEKTPQVQLIKTFYELLEVGEIEKAYNMRVEDEVPLEAFQNWYGTITQIRPRSFSEGKNPNEYSFLVDYSDGDTRGALYRVVMEAVEEDKINVIASWKIEEGTSIAP